MSFAQEMKDFYSGFKATYSVAADVRDAKARKDSTFKYGPDGFKMFGPGVTPSSGSKEYVPPEGEIKKVIDDNVPEGMREYAYKMAFHESGYDTNAVSSGKAKGLFQFINSTGAQYGLVGGDHGDIRGNPIANTQAFVRFTEDNRATLKKVLGREPSFGELAIAHQQGIGGAQYILTGKAPKGFDLDKFNSNLAVNNVKSVSEAANHIASFYGFDIEGEGLPEGVTSSGNQWEPNDYSSDEATVVPDSDEDGYQDDSGDEQTSAEDMLAGSRNAAIDVDYSMPEGARLYAAGDLTQAPAPVMYSAAGGAVPWNGESSYVRRVKSKPSKYRPVQSTAALEDLPDVADGGAVPKKPNNNNNNNNNPAIKAINDAFDRSTGTPGTSNYVQRSPRVNIGTPGTSNYVQRQVLESTGTPGTSNYVQRQGASTGLNSSSISRTAARPTAIMGVNSSVARKPAAPKPAAPVAPVAAAAAKPAPVASAPKPAPVAAAKPAPVAAKPKLSALPVPGNPTKSVVSTPAAVKPAPISAAPRPAPKPAPVAASPRPAPVVAAPAPVAAAPMPAPISAAPKPIVAAKPAPKPAAKPKLSALPFTGNSSKNGFATSSTGAIRMFAAGGLVDDTEEQVVEPASAPAPRPAMAIPPEGVTSAGNPRGSGREDLAMEQRQAQRSKQSETSNAIDAGLKYLTKSLGLDRVNAAVGDDPQLTEGRRKLVNGAIGPNEGPPTQQEIEGIYKVVDPNNELSSGLKHVYAMKKGYDFYMQNGQPEKAAKFAAGVIQYSNLLSRRFGYQAVEAGKNGDEAGMVKYAIQAYDIVPDGLDTDVKRGDGGYNVTRKDEDGNIVDQHMLTPQQIFQMATGISQGSGFFEAMMEAGGKKKGGLTDYQRKSIEFQERRLKLQEEAAGKPKAPTAAEQRIIEGNKAGVSFYTTLYPTIEGSLSPEQKKAWDAASASGSPKLLKEMYDDVVRRQDKETQKQQKLDEIGVLKGLLPDYEADLTPAQESTLNKAFEMGNVNAINRVFAAVDRDRANARGDDKSAGTKKDQQALKDREINFQKGVFADYEVDMTPNEKREVQKAFEIGDTESVQRVYSKIDNKRSAEGAAERGETKKTAADNKRTEANIKKAKLRDKRLPSYKSKLSETDKQAWAEAVEMGDYQFLDALMRSIDMNNYTTGDATEAAGNGGASWFSRMWGGGEETAVPEEAMSGAPEKAPAPAAAIPTPGTSQSNSPGVTKKKTINGKTYELRGDQWFPV